MKEIIKVVFMVLFILLIIAGMVCYTIQGDRDYNNGICKECGGKYHLKAVDKRIEYYECDTCGNVVKK